MDHTFDWQHPDYGPIWQKRVGMLSKLRNGDPEKGISAAQYLHACKVYYRENIDRFIEDWGVTVDPRNAGTGRPVIMPFLLFPKQREYLQWLATRWRGSEDGILVKSRDCGASWLAMAGACTLCLFWNDVSIGFGSRKEELVDAAGNPDSLFYKGRMFMRYVPRDFKLTWDERKNTKHMQLMFPVTGSSITGEAGDNIGRGGRKTVYIVDEFAYIERPAKVDAALSANTNCRIEMSSVNGLANTFAERARGGKIPRFDFDYRDDPRKCNIGTEAVTVEFEGESHIVHPRQAWPKFAKFLKALDPVVKASEYERDFLASIEGQIIEPAWVEAAINAAEKLGIKVTGIPTTAYDIADLGKDKNATAVRKGIELLTVTQWSGADTNANPLKSVRMAFEMCDLYGVQDAQYDADGMGGSWRVLFDLVNSERGDKIVQWAPFRGSGKVLDPESKTPGTDRTNEDYLENYKAQSWMALRRRFLETYKAISGEKYDPDGIISLSPLIPNLPAVMSELSQPTRTWSKTGKLMIDKTPDDVASPNLADAIMMAFCYARPPLVFSEEILQML